MELSQLLDKLKLDHLDHQLDAVCEQAAVRDLDYKSFLQAALATEWQGRFQRGIEARLRQSRFPWLKTLEQFDLDFQPSLDRRVVRELAGLSFVERGQNVVILGPPGVGKPTPLKYLPKYEICCQRPDSGLHLSRRRSPGSPRGSNCRRHGFQARPIHRCWRAQVEPLDCWPNADLDIPVGLFATPLAHRPMQAARGRREGEGMVIQTWFGQPPLPGGGTDR
jgi:hypothetical protein